MNAEKYLRAQCAHCGQTLPHMGTSWRETYRCRMFQSIAEQGWDECIRALAWCLDNGPSGAAPDYLLDHNPYRVLPPEGTDS